MVKHDEFTQALGEIDREPIPSGKKLIADHYDEIMELVNMGLSRAEVYRRVSARIDLGMSERTFSTYMSHAAKEGGE